MTLYYDTGQTKEREVAKGIRVTVEDLETGETESREFMDDYAIICAGNVFLDSTVTYSNGTHVLTVKREQSRMSQ